jgi:hypothetical protein
MCAANKSKKTAPAAAKSVAEAPDTATIDSVNAKFKQSIQRHLVSTLARHTGTADAARLVGCDRDGVARHHPSNA